MSGSKFSTYDQVGKVEDVSSFISIITPTKVPFQSSLSSGEKPTDTQYKWQEDSLDAAGSNAAIEGADAPAANMVATVMRRNTTQILTKTVKVTGTAEAVKTHGRKSELAHQLMKAGKAIKFDLEYHLCGVAQNAVAGADGATARKFGNILGNDLDSVAMVHSGNKLANGGTPRAFSEALVLAMLEQLYDVGGDATKLMIKPSDALIAANFAYATGRQREVGTSKTIVNDVSGYKSPYGEVTFVLNRHLLSSVAIAYDPENMKLRWLRPWQRKELAVVGDSESHQLLGEVGFQHDNYKASGIIADLS